MASRSLGTLTLDLVAKTGSFEAGMSKAERASSRTARQIQRDAEKARKAYTATAVAVGALGGALAGLAINSVIKNTVKMEKEQAQLAAVLKSTGEAAGYTKGQLNEMASAMSMTATVSSGEVAQAQTTLLAFTGIVGNEFTKSLQAATDMAARTGMSVVQAAETIGRALDVPSKGLASLSKQGFRFTDDQKKLAQQLEATGRTAEAQAIILDELESSYGGAAQAARDTFGGAVTALKNQLGDLMTGQEGSLDGATAAVNELSRTLASEETKAAFAAFVSMIAGATNAFASFMVTMNSGNFWGWAITSGDDAENAEMKISELAVTLENLKKTKQGFEDSLVPAWLNADDIAILNAQIATTESKLKNLREVAKRNAIPVVSDQIKLVDLTLAAPTGGGKGKGGGNNKAASDAAALQKSIDALVQQSEQLGWTSSAIKLYDLESKGATEGQLALAAAALEVTDAFAAQEKINAEAKGIFEGLRTEEEAILESYERRKEIILETTLATAEEKAELLRRLEEETNEELLKVSDNYWERYLAAAEESLTSFDEMAGNMIENFSSRFGAAFESMIFDSEDLGDSVRNMAEGMARSVVGALGQMAAQWLAYQVVQMLVGKTTAASASAAMVGNAAATSIQAGMAAYASTAAIPIIGPLAAPVAMATAISATAPMVSMVAAASMAGMAHDGIDSVPQTGTWLLEKGERVVTSETSAKLDATLSRIESGRGNGGVTVNLIEDSERAGQTEEATADNGEQELNIFVADIRGAGRRSQVLESTYGLVRRGS